MFTDMDMFSAGAAIVSMLAAFLVAYYVRALLCDEAHDKEEEESKASSESRDLSMDLEEEDSDTEADTDSDEETDPDEALWERSDDSDEEAKARDLDSPSWRDDVLRNSGARLERSDKDTLWQHPHESESEHSDSESDAIELRRSVHTPTGSEQDSEESEDETEEPAVENRALAKASQQWNKGEPYAENQFAGKPEAGNKGAKWSASEAERQQLLHQNRVTRTKAETPCAGQAPKKEEYKNSCGLFSCARAPGSVQRRQQHLHHKRANGGQTNCEVPRARRR